MAGIEKPATPKSNGLHPFTFGRQSWKITGKTFTTTGTVAPGGYLFTMSSKVSELNSIYPTECPILGRVRDLYSHWNWSLTDSGYIRYYLGDGPAITEHRLMAEVRYGRGISKYHVHHLDGVGTNNAEGNLQILSASDHAKVHGFGNKSSGMVIRQCATCGAKVEREPRKAKLHKLSFCSRDCFRNYSMTNWLGITKRPYTKPPERDELAILIESHTREEIGAMYGCLKHTVSRWITHYGLARSRNR